MAMRFERVAGSQPNHPHRHVVVAARGTAEELFPLRCAACGNLVGWPTCPLKLVQVFRGNLHGKADSLRSSCAF